MKQVNCPIEFYGDDFGADARLCHPSKEGILLWCPPAASAFNHGRAISPSPSARDVYFSAQKFEARLLRDISNVERLQQASVVCEYFNLLACATRSMLARP